MRVSLTMFCPPELRGAGRSRRTFEWSSGETLERLRRRESAFRIVGLNRSNFVFPDIVEDLVDDGAWRRIDVSSNSTLPPCVVARWVEEKCDEQSRTFSPLAAEVYSKEHQWPQASSSGAPLGEVANGTCTEL
ncbi:unnamed protein product [Brassica oleracea]